MTVKYVTGDLFKMSFDAVGHGVNCQGKMGSGIALEFKHRFPKMYFEYELLCKLGFLKTGQVFAYNTYQNHQPFVPLFVYNIASQLTPGPDARLEAIEAGMHYVKYHAEYHGLKTVGLPRIGAGIGGLSWDDVSATIESIVKDSPVEFNLVSLL